MSSKKKIISVIAASCFVATFGAASVVTAASISPVAMSSSNENIILAYSKKDTAENDEHHGDHEKMKSDDKGHKYHGKCNKMSKMDTNEDGKISRREFMKHKGAMFDKHDTNGDGFLEKDERRSMMKMHHGHKHGDKHGHGHGDKHGHGDDKSNGHDD